MDRVIRSVEDVLKPDESLAAWVADGTIRPGRALDLGCGPGRNAIHLAALGFEVDAVDVSPAAVAWGRDRARAAGVDVRFHRADAVTAELPGSYDLVYDSGCFHRLPPHQRAGYRALLDRALAPGGLLGLSCRTAGRPDGIFAGLTRVELRGERFAWTALFRRPS